MRIKTRKKYKRRKKTGRYRKKREEGKKRHCIVRNKIERYKENDVKVKEEKEKNLE